MPYMESVEPTLEQPNPCFKAETAPSRAFSEYSSRLTLILSLFSRVGFIAVSSFRQRSTSKMLSGSPTMNLAYRIVSRTTIIEYM